MAAVVLVRNAPSTTMIALFRLPPCAVFPFALLARLCGVLLVALLVATSASAQDDFLPPEQAFAFSAALAEPGEVELRYDIASGYYMYRERFVFALEPDAAALSAPQLPAGRVTYDPTFEKNMEVYDGGVLRIRVPIVGAISGAASSAVPQTLRITSQGCADAGLCYPPREDRVTLTPMANGYTVVVAAPLDPWGAATGLGTWTAATSELATNAGTNTSDRPVGLAALSQADDRGLARTLAGANGLITVGVFFLLGLLLAFTPCVLPMVPILSALIVGGERQRADADKPAPPARRRALALAAAYVAGMSVVYTLIGIAAGLSGVGLAAWLQTPWVLGVFAVLLTVLALAMFDVFAFQASAAWQSRWSARAARIPGGRATGAALMGAVSALIVGPCVAAPLAGALLYISQTGDVWLGGAALFALAWGMGAPLLLVGVSSGALLPRAGQWMAGVKHFFGVLLLATAWWILLPLLPSWLQMLGWAALAALAAVILRAFDALSPSARVGAIFAKTAGLLLALASVVQVVGVASGGRDPLQPLAHLAASVRSASDTASQNDAVTFTRIKSVAELDAALARADRPVMLDFYADWCVSCKEMERYTFSAPGVAAKLARLTVLQADVTANNADDRALLRRFRLFGPPGIVFFAADGRLLDARVIGFQNAARFEAVLAGVLGD